MMFSKYLFSIVLFILCFSASGQNKDDKNQIEKLISNWHAAAASADFESYFSSMSNEAVFIGTDASEYWIGKEFRDFAKPYFDNGNAWTFHTLNRNIFVDLKYKTAWFDELLETQMGVCRGSGVLVNREGQWKIKHYVLSITIPNEKVDEVKKLKEGFENQLRQNFKN